MDIPQIRKKLRSINYMKTSLQLEHKELWKKKTRNIERNLILGKKKKLNFALKNLKPIW